MILLLTEAGAGIGFGHLTRMMALGEALLDKGVPVFMLVQWEGPPAERVIEGRPWVQAGVWREDPALAVRALSASIVLVDSYRLALPGYESLAASTARLAVLDDFYRLPYPADLVINPNVYADLARYLPPTREAIGGVAHVILRAPFANAARAYRVRDSLTRVLLSLGGSDRCGLGLDLARALAAAGHAVHWIAPDHAPNISLPAGVTLSGTLGAAVLVNAIMDADLVVCGGGQTLHELACLGAPCVAVEIGDDQQLNLSFYEETGWIGPRLHGAEAGVVHAVVERVNAMGSAASRSERIARIANLVDGQGTGRLAERISRIAAAH